MTAVAEPFFLQKLENYEISSILSNFIQYNSALTIIMWHRPDQEQFSTNDN